MQTRDTDGAPRVPATFRPTKDASDPAFYDSRNRETYLAIHADSPVYWVDAEHTQPFLNVCRHDLIREVGKDVQRFTTEQGVHLNAAAFAVDQPAVPAAGAIDLPPALTPANIMSARDHRRVRGPVNPHFRQDAVAHLESRVREMVVRALDDIEPDEDVDFMERFGARVPLLVTTAMLGVDAAREHDFERWANAILTSFEPGAAPDWTAISDMVAFFTAEVQARRAAPRADLISDLLQTPLTDDEVVMWCWLLLVAGIETTGNLLGAGMDLLLRHPDQMERLVRDPTLLRPAVAEMLRIVTPGRYIRRTATEDTTIGDCPVHAGDAVVMNFTVANYDPAMFSDPLRFDIDRNPNETLAFSYGPHRCIGMPVARMEAIVGFEELLRRFPATSARGPAIFRPSLATVVVESLPVRFAGP
ncbi:MAG: cytochrome P450 [Solirubrobacteraceae bacterium]